MKIHVLAVAFVAMAAVSAQPVPSKEAQQLMTMGCGSNFTLYNIVPFSPGFEEQAAADCREYKDRTGCDLVLYSLTLHPEGRPAMEKVERYVASYRRLKRELFGSSVRPCRQVATTSVTERIFLPT